MNLAKSFFSNLALLNRTSSADATFEGVASVRLMGLARAHLLTWRHVGASRARSCGVTGLCRLLWRDWRPNQLTPRVHQSWQSRRRDSVVLTSLARLALT
jgi:hypothetical protein